MYNKGKQFEYHFSFMGQNVKNNVYFGAIFGALRGSSMIILGLYYFTAILSLNPKFEKNFLFFSYLGGPGGALRRTQVNANLFQGSKTS